MAPRVSFFTQDFFLIVRYLIRSDRISLRNLLLLPTNVLNIFVNAINHSLFTRTTDDLANHRPIALLLTSAKVVKRLVKSRVMPYLNKDNILNRHHFSFQSIMVLDAIFNCLEYLY